MQLASHSPLEPTLQPALHRAIALSHRRNRQIWVIWIGNKSPCATLTGEGEGFFSRAAPATNHPQRGLWI